MRKKILLLFGLISLIINYSCEENFSPKGDFQQKYILNCIIRADTSLQTATLSKSYNVSGYDPYINTEDPFLSKALIRLWQGDSVYFMKDSSIARTDTSRYDAQLHFFYLDNFLLRNQKDLEIEAILPDGKTLSARTTLPDPVEWNFSNINSGDTNTFSIPSATNDYFTFRWYESSSLGWYLARFIVIYSKTVNGVEEIKRVVVPQKYENVSGQVKAVYPAPTKNLIATFQNSALDSVFNQISAGDPNKARYKIYGGIFQLLVFDQNLSKYYSSTNGYLDDYTVRLDQTDFTNVQGGLGIFGSFIKQQRGNLIDADYIRSFGYISNVE
jgi:hypothetical protein